MINNILTFSPISKKWRSGMAQAKPSEEEDDTRMHDSASQRFTVSLPAHQNDALTALAKETGLSKNDLLRNAVGLLNAAYRARLKGLSLSLTNEKDEVVAHIVSTV